MNFYSSNFVGWDILNGSPCRTPCIHFLITILYTAGFSMDVPSNQHGRPNFRLHAETGSNAGDQSAVDPDLYSPFRVVRISVFENRRSEKTFAKIGYRRLVGGSFVRCFGNRGTESPGWSQKSFGPLLHTICKRIYYDIFYEYRIRMACRP